MRAGGENKKKRGPFRAARFSVQRLCRQEYFRQRTPPLRTGLVGHALTGCE